MRELPRGTVTFLFTDIEGSTRLLEQLGAEAYAQALAAHRTVIRAACGDRGGVEVDTEGDAFFVAFPTAQGALAAAAAFSEGLAQGPIRVRVGLHTGTPLVAEDNYVGLDVHRAARIAAAGHGGQVLVSSTTAALTGTDALRDLGEHRFKDLSAPERVYQLGEGEFPRLKTLYQTNLPVPATPFVGRDRELEEASELLRDGVRLLTLSGPGGTGKTRLALQAAGAAADGYPDGVWWVPLAPLSDPALVLPTAGEVLAAKGELAPHIAGKRLLLLLDNFEHLIEAARELAALIGACPNLTLLVTSRERLQLAGEHEYAVPAMAPPDGLALFAARARALGTEVDGDDAALELCERLDNLPLALELAAARTKLFSPTQLLERLGRRLDLFKGGRDADPRQRTLRATIEWSHELLSPAEQELFARLAVFAGGCTYEAAEEICEADEDTLQSLLDKSLVRHSGERFWMLETIRDYAVERLEDSGEGPVIRARRDDYFLTLAEHAGPELPTDRQSYWLPRLDAESANLRVVVASALENGHPDVVCRLATSLWRYWEARDRIAEARRLIEPGIEREAGVSDAVRAQALFAAGRLAARQGDHAAARSWFAAGVRNAAEDDCVRAQCLSGLGWIAVVEGDEEKAERLCEQSLALARSSCDALVIADSLNNLGASTYLRSPETARAAWEESLALRRQIGDLEGVTASLGNLAQLALREGDLEHATVLARESQSLAKERGDLWTIGMSSLVLATVSIVGGQVSEAWRQVRRAIEVGDAAQHKSLSAYAIALAAVCFALEARDRDAARLEGAAEALDPSYDVSRDEPFQVIGDSLSSSRERLGEAEWLAAHEAGKHLGVREALGLITDASPWA